ncbi:nuclear transport factor 2 family protein [Flavobacterium sp. SUN052]|uniref:nuclear transport factor 2 family protein n=1 Tax=Flavobacterium sp. SUN052 TaxID=3002441 RepID=UPI00237E566F|nr:nuclear transport factor 2 family protein [Flavobacterium sp. SUN052]MEC4003722.1 nuclear transport factor 2 family protein [Flavobacterium sp. SUN052]
MQSTKNTIDQFLNFLSKRDLENLTLLFAKNIDWNLPGNPNAAEWFGQRNTREEVKEFYQLLWKKVEPISGTINNIFIDKEDAVIAGEFTVKMLSTGKLVSSIFYIQMTIKNGLIEKYRLLEDSFAISESLIEPIKK